MNYSVKSDALTQSADSIRSKSGSSASIPWDNLTGFKDAIDAIPTGGGSTLITKTITVNGTYDAQDDDADGYSEVTVTVPAPSVPFVTGTFTGTDSQKGSAIEITVPYSGSGYPIAIYVYPTAGAYKSTSLLYTTVQKNAIIMFAMAKSDMSLAPNYSNSGANDYGTTMAIYKSSDSDASATTSNRVNTEGVYRNNTATAAHSTAFRVRSATHMSAYIANTTYGFMAGVEYTYVIQYSA